MTTVGHPTRNVVRHIFVVLIISSIVVVSGAPLAVASEGPTNASTSVTGSTVARGEDAAVSRESREPGRVLIVTIPRVTWATLDQYRPPNLMKFLQDASVASLSTRTVGSRTAPDQAYLTIGSGNRTAAVRSVPAGEFVPADVLLPQGPAAAEFERRTGVVPSPDALLGLNFVMQQTRNDRLLYGSRPGALAQSLNEAGFPMGAIGNAATILGSADDRDVALAAADDSGQVIVGSIDDSLLAIDEDAPYGLVMDADVYETVLRDTWRRSAVAIVELSDTERVERSRVFTRSEQSDRALETALRNSDELFARLLDTVDTDRDMVIVTSPTAPLRGEELTLFAITGPGVPTGWAVSSTTRRAGYVSLTDIAPTVLRFFDVDVPESMYDTPISGRSSHEPIDERIKTMIRANERALFADQATSPLTIAFIALLVTMLVTVVVIVARGTPISEWVRILVLMVFAMPATMYSAGLLPYGLFNTATYGMFVALVALLVGFGASRFERIDPVLPSLILGSLSLAVMLIDVLTGASLQINTIFGYSPIVAGRFAGYGNQAFALVGISALVVATTGWQFWAGRRPGSSNTPRLLALLVFFLVVIVLVGLPQFGSDVGGVLASVPAFAVCALLLSGRRINVRNALAIAVGSVAVLGLFALIDLARPPEDRTHLSRFVAKLFAGEAPVILERKLSTNLSILTTTVWTLTIPLALAFFAYLAWRPGSVTRSIREHHATFRAFEISFLTLGVVAFALNDSGIALPAMMLAIVLPHTAFLTLGVESAGSTTFRNAPPRVSPGPP